MEDHESKILRQLHTSSVERSDARAVTVRAMGIGRSAFVRYMRPRPCVWPGSRRADNLRATEAPPAELQGKTHISGLNAGRPGRFQIHPKRDSTRLVVTDSMRVRIPRCHLMSFRWQSRPCVSSPTSSCRAATRSPRSPQSILSQNFLCWP